MSDARIVARAQAADPVLVEGEPAVLTTDLSGHLRVSGGGGGGAVTIDPAVDLRTDAIVVPDDASSIAAYGLSYNEKDGIYVRDYSMELDEGSGFADYNRTTAALPYLWDDVNNDYFWARGRVGVQLVREQGPFTAPTYLATSCRDLAVGEFRRQVVVGAYEFDLVTFSSSSSTRWAQVWDVDATSDVPGTPGVSRPILQVAVGVGVQMAPPLPAHFAVTLGICVVFSTVPDYYSAPAAGEQDDLAFSLRYFAVE